MDKLQLRKLQLIQAKILEEVARICEKHGIRYFLISGTLLGAVRHQGFIPWDDDIDIGMPRRDYERFLSIAQKEFPKEYFLQTYATEDEYPIHFAKVRNSNTTYMMIRLANCKINHGVCIDIAPLDGKPGFTGRYLLSVYKAVLARYRFKNLRCKSIIKELLVKYLDSKYTPYEINERIKKLMSRYDFDRSEYVGNFFGVWGIREIFPREFFGKGTKLQFEGKLYSCPDKYEEYLTQLYGPNCLEIPDEKNQNSHHGLLAMDLGKSYLDHETVQRFQKIITEYPITITDINQEDTLVMFDRIVGFINEIEQLPVYSCSVHDVLWLFPLNHFFRKLAASKREIIEEKLKENDSLRHLYLRYLFMNKKYRNILKYTGLERMDVSYYLGRTYKELKKYDVAIVNLKKALALLESPNRQFFDEKNILIATYFHLGEVYYKKRELSEAREYFYKCKKAANDMHVKASEYLNKIESSQLLLA